ncbi:Mur ligase family protein [Patescibacteria group bacterium]
MFHEQVRKIRNWHLIQFFRQLLPHWLVNLLYHFPKSFLAVLYYQYPAKNLTVIGVTGTDGKTSTATLIYEILKKAGKKVALVSTVSAKIGNLDLETGFHVTSPDPWKLQQLLRQIVNKEIKYVVLEATSHGLAQYRLLGCNFYLGVVTNITHEHLDYHKTFSSYLLAKAKLIKKTKYSILNNQDSSFKILGKIAQGKVISYGLKNADYSLENYSFKTSLPGEFNLLNSLAAIAVAKTLKIDDKSIKKGLILFKGVRGRMEEIKVGQNFRVFIDFAHTPNALENALKTLSKMGSRVIAVFGCAGLRDKEKRPMMGKIACQLADIVVLTAEDPRKESILTIISDIKAGCQQKNKIIVKTDRKEAIDHTITKLAKKGDIVGFFGKGHEQSMCYGVKEQPWSEHEVIEEALKRRINK